MNTGFRASLSTHLCFAAMVSALLVFPIAAEAQDYTFYGTKSGPTGSTFTGGDDTGFGWYTLNNVTTGDHNSAFGGQCLQFNTEGSWNVAVGTQTLQNNVSGNYNTATGVFALYTNSTGWYNTANGYNALFNNTATGPNTTGSYNTASGASALYSNTIGTNNTAQGVNSLYSNKTGSYNTADGYNALYYATGGNNIGIGNGAGSKFTKGSGNIAIGNIGTSTDTGIIRIGTAGTHKATYIAGISGVNVSGGVNVVVNSNGQLGIVGSSRRFKKDIHTMGSISDKLMQLRPVTFRYKQAAEDGTHPLQYGLIAEEVAKVYPDLVQYDKQGKPLTVYYHLLTPMILSALQKEHRQNVAMQTALATQNTKIAAMEVAHKAEMTAMAAAHNAEIAELKQSLAKLAAYVEASQNKAPVQKAVFVQH